jgi:predicted acetyltransferase
MSSDEHTVSVMLATLDEKPLIDGLAQFYIYDFSEMGPSTTDFPFDASGRFYPLPHFDEFWSEAGRSALVIRSGTETAGFALLNTHSHLTGGEVERNMAEFFVARGFRRHGVGMAAVRQILAAYPGHWEIAVVERNTGAKAFWPRAIAAAPNVSGIVQHQGDGQNWRGPIWSFEAA